MKPSELIYRVLHALITATISNRTLNIQVASDEAHKVLAQSGITMDMNIEGD